jgi:hypothetical protein
VVLHEFARFFRNSSFFSQREAEGGCGFGNHDDVLEGLSNLSSGKNENDHTVSRHNLQPLAVFRFVVVPTNERT